MTLQQPTSSDDLRRDVASAIHAHWGLFLFEGIVLVLLGFAAIVVPVVATLAFTLVIGWLFLISGGVGLVTTFWMRNAPGFWWALLSAVIALAAGVILILWPINGVLSLTLVLIAFFAVEGIATLMYAFEHKAQLSGRWVWMLASGRRRSHSRRHYLRRLARHGGLGARALVGINMLFGGTAMIGMALAARNPA